MKSPALMAKRDTGIDIYDPTLVLYLPLADHGTDVSPFPSRDLNHHIATVTGATWGLQGRTFDGTDDWIDCGSSSVLKPTGDFTVGARFKLDNLTGGNWVLFDEEVYRASGFLLRIDRATNTTGQAFLRTNQVSADTGITGNTILSTDTWYTLYATKLGTTGTFFLNGVADGTGTLNNPVLATKNLFVSNDGAQRMKGTIGEVWMYNRALSAAEVQQNYLVTKWRYI